MTLPIRLSSSTRPIPAALTEIVRGLEAEVAGFSGNRPAGDDRSLVVLRRLRVS